MPPKMLPIVRKQSVSAPTSPSPGLKHLSKDPQPQPLPPSQSFFAPPSPILRWFQNQRSLPSSLSRPQTPHSAALSEAMSDHLPARPEPAHLPPEHHANIRPPLINELTRSTLPTSSITAPTDRLEPRPDSAHASLLDRIPPSAPARTSLDTLRTLYNKATTAKPPHQQTRSISIPAPFRNWFQTETVKDGDKHKSILTEEDRDDNPEVERENIRRKCKHSSTVPTIFPVLSTFSDLAPKNPIVFCHGLLGFDSVTIGPAIAPLEVAHWRGIKEVLQSNGVDVLITRVPATSSPVDRAQVLAKRISEVYSGKKIHLIGLFPSILQRGGLCTYMQALLTLRS